jgi:hypothetical protein
MMAGMLFAAARVNRRAAAWHGFDDPPDVGQAQRLPGDGMARAEVLRT